MVNSKNSTRMCPICNSICKSIFSVCIFEKDRPLYECQNLKCKHAHFTEVNWLEKAYSNAIVALDTGAVSRCLSLCRASASIITMFGLIHPKIDGPVIDYGGGTGLLTRLLRDLGLDSFNYDKYCRNTYAIPFEAKNGHYAALTMIEVLEHFVDPIAEIVSIKKRFNPEIIIATTVTRPSVINKNWWYLTPSTGQHINFYSNQSLAIIANKIGYHILIKRNIIILFRSQKPYISKVVLSISLNVAVKQLVYLVRCFVFRRSYQNDFETVRKNDTRF